MCRDKIEVEELLKIELSKWKKDCNSLKSSYQKLNDDYLTVIDLLRDKKAKKAEVTRLLKLLEIKLSDEKVFYSIFYSETQLETLNSENSKLKKQIEEKDWIFEQNHKNLLLKKEELTEQLKITKSSELCLKKSWDRLNFENNEKEKLLNTFDEKFKLAEESLKLFYTTIKYKENEINSEKL